MDSAFLIFNKNAFMDKQSYVKFPTFYKNFATDKVVFNDIQQEY
jgi:hypothetical protein